MIVKVKVNKTVNYFISKNLIKLISLTIILGNAFNLKMFFYKKKIRCLTNFKKYFFKSKNLLK